MADTSILIFLMGVFLASISQILLKTSARKTYAHRALEYLNLHVVSAYGLFFVSIVLSVVALRGMDLKNAPILESASYLFVLVLGRIFLGERITPLKLLGNALIIVGIVVFNAR